MKKLLVASIAAMTFATQSSAVLGLVDLKAGGGGWINTPTADITATVAGTTATLTGATNSLNLKGGFNTYYYFDINHFVPLVPNVRYKHQALSISGANANAALGTVKLGPISLNVTGALNTSINLAQDDFILYWNVPLTNLISAVLPLVDFALEFGVDTKIVNGNIGMDIGGTAQNLAIKNLPVPMGYLAAKIDVPLLPSVYGEYKTIGIFTDWEVRADYVLPLPIPLIKFGVEAGYKSQYLGIDASAFPLNLVTSGTDLAGQKLTINNDGIFFGLNAAF